jgi:large subunit ribosomal protein L21
MLVNYYLNYCFMKQAVIKTGGKQYLVTENDIVKIEKLPVNTGDKFEFDKVLAIFDKDGKAVKVGDPYLKDVKISAEILDQGRAKKIRVVHYKAKTRHHKVYGHRQPFTQVKIGKIA